MYLLVSRFLFLASSYFQLLTFRYVTFRFRLAFASFGFQVALCWLQLLATVLLSSSFSFAKKTFVFRQHFAIFANVLLILASVLDLLASFLTLIGKPSATFRFKLDFKHFQLLTSLQLHIFQQMFYFPCPLASFLHIQLLDSFLLLLTIYGFYLT